MILMNQDVPGQTLRDFRNAGVSVVNPFDPATWDAKSNDDPIALL